jgi:SagB-type dehydrogenase family enzyme
VVAGQPQPAAAQEMAGLALPRPQLQGGRPLMQALSDRKTTRTISEEKLSPQMLSNLLWAAWGVNRPANNGRTAPSANNAQEISVYVFLEQGVYLFDEKAHNLKPVAAGDHRTAAGAQPGVAKAPVNLVYVADLDKYRAGQAAESKLAFSNAHAGFIGQNVYLFAASEGLASWFRASVDAPAVAQLLSLRPGQKVLYGQTVGYPAKG